SGYLETMYVCKSLTWWQTGVLVAELKLVQYSPEMVVFSSRATMDRQLDFLTVPIPWDAQLWNEQPMEDVYELFMRRLTPLLTQLDMELRLTDQTCSALTSLALSARSWS